METGYLSEEQINKFGLGESQYLPPEQVKNLGLVTARTIIKKPIQKIPWEWRYPWISEITKEFVPYSQFLFPEARKEFMQAPQEEQHRSLLNELLVLESYLGFPRIAKGLGEIVGAATQRFAPGLYKTLTKPLWGKATPKVTSEVSTEYIKPKKVEALGLPEKPIAEVKLTPKRPWEMTDEHFQKGAWTKYPKEVLLPSEYKRIATNEGMGARDLVYELNQNKVTTLDVHATPKDIIIHLPPESKSTPEVMNFINKYNAEVKTEKIGDYIFVSKKGEITKAPIEIIAEKPIGEGKTIEPIVKRGKLTINYQRGGSKNKMEIGGTFVDDKFIGQDKATIAYGRVEKTYGIYDKNGNQIKGGFDKASEAIEYAKKPIAEVKPSVSSGRIVMKGDTVTVPEKPQLGNLIVVDNSDPSLLVVKNELGNEFRVGRSKVQKVASEVPPTAIPIVETQPPIQPIPKSPISPSDDPVKKVIAALKEAKPIRKEQEALYTKERGRRLTEALKVGEEIRGEKGFYAELGKFKGEMPKVQFESIRRKINQGDIDSLFIKVKESPLLDEWDKISAREGLAKLFGEYGGQVPTGGELKLLDKVFGSDFVKTTLEKRTFFQKMTNAGYELANIPRALMASFDLSAPFRQGIFLIGRPKQFGSAFLRMFKPFVSEKAWTKINSEIALKPSYKLMKEYKLALTDMDTVLSTREEAFMSSWAEKIPLVGMGVRASNRAYTGFLNKLRADVFDDLIKKAGSLGLDPQNNPELVKSLASFINSATGRGNIGSLQIAAPIINSIFFSPRLMASRINLLNPAYYIRLDPFVRKEAIKSLLTFTGTGLTVLGLAKMSGAEVGTDPRSADFGKIKIGNTRFDIWGGFQQYIKFATQLITGQLISSTTGKLMTLGEGYRPLTRLDIIGRFATYKTAPVASFVTDLLRGQSNLGQPLDMKSEIAQRFIPMATQDTYDAAKEWGLPGIPMSIPAYFGVGMQTYKREPIKRK